MILLVRASTSGFRSRGRARAGVDADEDEDEAEGGSEVLAANWG